MHARCPEKDEMPPEVHEKCSGNVLLQQITQSADIVTSEAKQPGVPAFTQTETKEKRHSHGLTMHRNTPHSALLLWFTAPA